MSASDGLFERVLLHARTRPGDPAITETLLGGHSHETSWASLAERARTLAGAISVLEQPIVPILAGRGAETVAALLGTAATGKAFSALDPRLRPPQVVGALSALGATHLLVDGRGLMALRQLEPAATAGLTIWMLSPPEAAAHSRVAAALGATLIPAAEPIEQAVPGVTGCCLFTSGSTGTPKGVLVAAADLLGRAEAEIESYALTTRDRLLGLLPFSFDVGLNQLCSALVVGCELVLSRSWLPADLLATVAARSVTGISAAPSIWADLLGGGHRFDREGPHASLRYVTISGGDLAPAQRAELPTALGGAGIFKTYGQTEAFRATLLRPEEYAERPASVGRPFGGVRIYIVDADGAQLGPDEVGEVVHVGLGTMSGYLDGRDIHKRRPNPFEPPPDVAIFTGDQGHLDAAGYLFLAGRGDGMLKISGNRIYPREVEAQLLALDDVTDAVVLGLEGPKGVSLVAFVRAETAPNALRRELASRLPSYMVPSRIERLDALPRTATGKPDRQTLLARAHAAWD